MFVHNRMNNLMIQYFHFRYSICKPKMCNNENIALIIFLWEIDVDRNERRENVVQIELDAKRFNFFFFNVCF